jgi:F0F1-type ATP synthase membrane subunit c/vacuolar-type H+-ATPase subunit K
VWSPWVVARAREAADALAARLGISTPPLAWIAFAAQISNETNNGDPSTIGVHNANPFNLTTAHGTLHLPGEIGAGEPGGSADEWHTDFARFADPATGARAAGEWYSAEGDPAGYYAGVRRAFIGGDPVAIARAIEASPFATGHYSYSLAPAVARDLGMAQEVDSAPIASSSAIASAPAAAAAAVSSGVGRAIAGAASAPIAAVKGEAVTRLVVVLVVILALVIVLEGLS